MYVLLGISRRPFCSWVHLSTTVYVNMFWLQCTTIIVCLVNLATGDQPKIVIVGAGAAGIAAASKLYENGFGNITILEAEDRIGGRVHSTWFDEGWIELGSQWVHGETGNVVFELASPLGLLEIPENTDLRYIVHDSEGRQIPVTKSNNLFRLFFDLEARAYEDLKGSNGSVGEYFTRMITDEAEKYPADDKNLLLQFMQVFEGYRKNIDPSENWYIPSARGYLEYSEGSGNRMTIWKDRGYGTILDILMRRYPDSANELPVLNNTMLNTEVERIYYNSTPGKVLVETSSGENYTADHVIFTPSLGVLKEQYETLFAPELPEHKVKTIKGLEFGATGKIFVSFEAPWWPDDFDVFALLWNESDEQEYEDNHDKKWLLDLAAFSVLAHSPRVLYGWVNAPGARYMETLPEGQVLNQTFEVLEKFFGKTYNVTRPSKLLRSQWYANKHFRGTYTYRSMETEIADVWADQLAAPLLLDDEPLIMFAGAATHPHHYGTVHGAIESGFREADRLIEIYKHQLDDLVSRV